MAHARLAPSSAHKWVRCPRSVPHPDRPDDAAVFTDSAGRAAAEGSAFHHFLEKLLGRADDEVREVPDVFSMLGDTVTVPYRDSDGVQVEEVFSLDQDMAIHIMEAVDYLTSIPGFWNMSRHIEVPLDMSFLGEEAFGTADVVLVDDTGVLDVPRLIVLDWKYGAGVAVEADDNPQMLLYLLAAWDRFMEGADPAAAHAEAHIFQPRHHRGGGLVSMTGEELLARRKKFVDAAERSRDPDAPGRPGEWCHFCDRRKLARCPWLNADVLEAFGVSDVGSPESIEASLVEPKVLSPDEISAIVLAAPHMRRWLDEVHAIALKTLEDGGEIPGLKLVWGRKPPRRYSDPDEAAEVAEKAFGEAAFERKLLSPAKMEKKAGKTAFQTILGGFVTQGSPKPIVVSDDDPREAITPASDLF